MATFQLRQNFKANYGMVSPMIRSDIIEKINNGIVVSLFEIPPAGIKADWTHKKHYPENEIPTRIYLLSGGKIENMHQTYMRKYGEISWEDFRNYTRELIRQGIMIEMCEFMSVDRCN